ncbi:hypothetical protein C3747_121g54 [Trypanosoma cruzi]|nr:hypothetical protein C3747_121g54 [Trypanosoma cruzi]
MWSVVGAKQKPSRRRREKSAAKRKQTDAIFTLAPTVSSRMISALVRDLRRTSEALRGLTFVCRDILSPVRRFLETRVDVLTRVHLIALGIGPFSRQESRSGFLQMAFLLALKKECENVIKKQSKSLAPAAVRAQVDTFPGAGATCLSCGGSPGLFTSFFDPVAGELYACCCEKLGVIMEKENRYGAYTPNDLNALLIAYLPHCPWALLRNLFVSNLLPCREFAGAGHVGQLGSVLVVGNDLRGMACRENDFMEALIPFLRFDTVRVEQKKGNPRGVDRVEDVDNSIPSGLRGISRNDIACAFSDTAVMQKNTEREAEFLEALPRLRLPPLVRDGPDLL